MFSVSWDCVAGARQQPLPASADVNGHPWNKGRNSPREGDIVFIASSREAADQFHAAAVAHRRPERLENVRIGVPAPSYPVMEWGVAGLGKALLGFMPLDWAMTMAASLSRALAAAAAHSFAASNGAASAGVRRNAGLARTSLPFQERSQ